MATVYSINYTDRNEPSFIINPSQIDGFGGPKSNSSLILHGTGRLKYGEALNENFLHLLENFSSPARASPLVLPIQNADDSGGPGIDYIEIFDDKTDIFINGFEFQIVGSTSSINDNNYLVALSSYNQPNNLTTIILQSALPDAQAGVLGNVSYNIIEPDPLMVVPPYNSGQLWFNKTDGVLYIYRDISGTGIFQWDYAGRLGVTIDPPAFPNEGDLWYDQSVPQLKVYTGSAFISVGDRYILKSGDTISSDSGLPGSIGHTDGTLIFNNAAGTNGVIYINEGQGIISDGPDIRTSSAMSQSAGDLFNINFDADNLGTSDFVISKGSHLSGSQIPLFTIENDGTIHTYTPNYETLLTDPNDIPNKKFVDDEILAISTSIASDFVKKSGDLITPIALTGSVGTNDGTLSFTNNSNTPVLSINEGYGVIGNGPDIRATDSMSQTSDESFLITFDGLNTGSGNFIINKGSHLINGSQISLVRVENDGTLHVDTANYEALITNNNDVPNKKYVDDEILALQNTLLGTGGGTFVHVNPTLASSGDIRVTGTGATLEIFIYGDSVWNKVFPAVYSN